MTEIQLTLPAISVQPPWSHAIAWLGKDRENRYWPVPPKLLGTDIAIHATKSVDEDTLAGQQPRSWHADHDGLPGDPWPPLEEMAIGAVVAVARIAGCHHAPDCAGPLQSIAYGLDHDTLCSPWAAWGQYHWELTDVRPLMEPVQCRGFQRIWYLPEAADQEVQAQLAGLAAATGLLHDELTRVTIRFYAGLRSATAAL
jgi:hypothetical protein